MWFLWFLRSISPCSILKQVVNLSFSFCHSLVFNQLMVPSNSLPVFLPPSFYLCFSIIFSCLFAFFFLFLFSIIFACLFTFFFPSLPSFLFHNLVSHDPESFDKLKFEKDFNLNQTGFYPNSSKNYSF